MQKIAAYIVEQPELHSPDAREAEGQRICGAIDAWLAAKGAGADPLRSGDGTYAAVDGSQAAFRTLRERDGERSWTMVELTENSPEGRVFVASASVTVGRTSVVVYVTLEVGSVATQVNRIDVDPKCPKLVRDLLSQSTTWYHRASRLRTLTRVEGFDAGETLAAEIRDEQRTIPFVVVSLVHGQGALDDLEGKLAYDLAGIANVYSTDEAASWALTDSLRRSLSCHSGAVRIYWPGLSMTDDPFRHHLWTWSRIRSADDDPRQALVRLRRTLRSLVMRASAVSIVRPREIDEIRSAAARAEYAALKNRASSLEDFKELADSYANDNDELRRTLDERTEELKELRNTVAKLENERNGLLFHLRQAKPNLDLGLESHDVEPDRPEVDDQEEGPPAKGETRFYKKRYSAPTHDVLVRVGDCGHNAWQSATKADKAKKGISKLEDGRQDWDTLHHCGTCTGGGMWRVQW